MDCFEKAIQVAASFVDPITIDVEGVGCGDDLLSQFCSFGPSVREGQSLLVMGNAVIYGLIRSDVFRNYIRSLNIGLYICWIGKVPETSLALDQKESFAVFLDPTTSDSNCFSANQSVMELCRDSFDCVWVNACPSNYALAISAASCMLKSGGIIKAVFPAIPTQENVFFAFLQQELSLQLESKSTPRRYAYVPPSSSRPHMEYFAVFSRVQRALVQPRPFSPIALQSGMCIDSMVSLSNLVLEAMQDFVDVQRLTRKLMQTVWLKGCYLVALLVSEAELKSQSGVEVSIFRARLLVCLKQAFFPNERFVISEEDELFYNNIKSKFHFSEMSGDRRKLSTKMRKTAETIDECVKVWTELLNIPLASFSAHHNLPELWGITQRAQGMDPIASFVFNAHMEMSLCENTKSKLVGWMRSLLPNSIMSICSANKSMEDPEPELNFQFGVTMIDPPNDDLALLEGSGRLRASSRGRDKRASLSDVVSADGAHSPRVKKKRQSSLKLRDRSKPKRVKRAVSQRTRNAVVKAVAQPVILQDNETSDTESVVNSFNIESLDTQEMSQAESVGESISKASVKSTISKVSPGPVSEGACDVNSLNIIESVKSGETYCIESGDTQVLSMSEGRFVLNSFGSHSESDIQIEGETCESSDDVVIMMRVDIVKKLAQATQIQLKKILDILNTH